MNARVRTSTHASTILFIEGSFTHLRNLNHLFIGGEKSAIEDIWEIPVRRYETFQEYVHTDMYYALYRISF